MMRNISLGTIAAAALLAVAVPQSTQAQGMAPKVAPCNLQWCPILVQVVKNTSGADVVWVSFDQLRLAQKYTNATIIWELVGSPDYEFRVNSVSARGSNAAAAPAEFPLRLISPTQYAYDDLNNDSRTFEYNLRVYKKGAPASAEPLTSTGSVVNAGG